MKNMSMQDLSGVFVKEARYDGEAIYLNLRDGGSIALIPEGDCCAHCYILNVSGSEVLLDAEIKSVEDLTLEPTEQEVNDHECIEAWGHRILTNKGICTIEMRVSHNGYYGGWLHPHASEKDNSDKLLEDF